MAPGRKRKNVGSNSQAASRRIKPVNRKKSQKATGSSDTGVATRRGTRTGLRSGPSIPPRFEDNPESLLSKNRKAQKFRKAKAQDLPENPAARQPDIPVRSIETALAEINQRFSRRPFWEFSSKETSLSTEDRDPEQTFYRFWGYLPPLDEEAIAVIDAIIANPDMAKQYTRINPDSPNFPEGLNYRNVSLKESSTHDLQAVHVEHLVLKSSVTDTHRGNDDEDILPKSFVTETEGEKELYGQLWTFDQIKCNEGSNEALFQRTLMMSLIARHSFIYGDAINRRCLDFSVEEIWTCPPMPTRAYDRLARFLTQPKPDLAVCFRRETVIPDALWRSMPHSTRRLACCENMDDIQGNRVFHFFTIEAKKANISTNDNVGKRQSLNNASQALHNMFEFFRDAGKQHEDIFFEKVRFFSVVASTEGLSIRVHRAIKVPTDANSMCFVTKGYPLEFEYREFSKIERDQNFDRRTVLKTFEKILIAYGADELQHLLRDAAKAIMEKLENDVEGIILREKDDFYRYGQTFMTPDSRKLTPAPSRTQSEANFSVDRLGSGTATPMRNQAATSLQSLSTEGKRLRQRSEDNLPPWSTRPRRL